MVDRLSAERKPSPVTLVIRGQPVEFEIALQRALRAMQLAIALPVTAVLYWLQLWWWLPLPLAGSFLVYEALYAGRRDRPTVLSLGPTGLALTDALRGQDLTVPWDEIEVANATWHRIRGGFEGVVMLGGAAGPRIGLRFVTHGPPTGLAGEVDLDRVDVALGGAGGRLPAVHAVAPFEAIGRQRFDDPRALAFLRDRIPAAAWDRAAARIWTGEAPALDPFGYHVQEPDGWLVFDRERWTLRRLGTGEPLAEGSLRGAELSTRTRPARLRLEAGAAPVDVEVQLLAIALPGGPRVHLPAAGAGQTEIDPDPADAHTHFPEGGSLVHHLLRWVPAADLPEPLRTVANSDAR